MIVVFGILGKYSIAVVRECLVPVCARVVRVRVCARGLCACVCSVRAFACLCACLSTCLYLLCALCECTVCACACTGKARGTSCCGSRDGQMLLADAWPVLSYKAHLCARMDAATLGAAMAAITTRRTTRNTASEALSIAVEILKPSYRIAKTLAMALRRSFWPGFESRDITYALARAGERMIVYDDIRKEYQAALESVLHIQETLSWPTEGWQPEIDEPSRLRLYTAEIALKLAEEEKACEEYGPHQTAWLQVLADIDEMGDCIRVYPVCRARVKGDKNPFELGICGFSFPSCLWTRSENGHEFICKINWAAFERKLGALHDHDPIHGWASLMRSRHGSTHNWPEIGCGASFYPTWEESTCVVEVRREDTRQWEAFAADPPPLEITDEINMLLARNFLPGPLRINRGCNPRSWGEHFAPLSPPHTHHYQNYPIIAKYPLEAWELANRPSLSPSGWCKLARTISMNTDPPTPRNCKLLRVFDLTREPKQRTQQRINCRNGQLQGESRMGTQT